MVIKRDQTRGSEHKITPVILAGGRGSRLRPLTGEKSPKPFLRLFSEYSLFQETVFRSLDFGAPVVVCHQGYLPFVQDQLAEIGVKPRAIILEPDHKGMAPAIALAAFYLKNKGEVMLVMPSDHLIDPVAQFQFCVPDVPEAILEDHLVLMGVKPRTPETSYGYIKIGDFSDGVGAVETFVEKPDRALAAAFVKSGEYLWNTGIFMTRPRVYLRLLKTFDLEMYGCCERSYFAHIDRNGICSADEEAYLPILENSVDYAVLESSQGSYAYRMALNWSDVGTWPRVIEMKAKRLLRKVSFRGNGRSRQSYNGKQAAK